MCSSQKQINAVSGEALVSVTFDTNTLSGVVDPAQRAGEADYAAYEAVHDAVKTGLIRGFFSEAVVTLDAMGRKTKSEVLGAARFVSETFSNGPRQVTIALGPRWRRVEIDPRILARVEAARSMGMRALIGPRRFGDSIVPQGFGDDFYEPYPNGPAFVEAADAANGLDAAIVQRGLGRARVIELAKSFSERDGAVGEWWPQGLQRTRSAAERKIARSAINEWADGEALAAHAGYRHDLFCTADRGGDLGERSVLHPSHHRWLQEGYGVTLISVDALAVRLATARETSSSSRT